MNEKKYLILQNVTHGHFKNKIFHTEYISNEDSNLNPLDTNIVVPAIKLNKSIVNLKIINDEKAAFHFFKNQKKYNQYLSKIDDEENIYKDFYIDSDIDNN